MIMRNCSVRLGRKEEEHVTLDPPLLSLYTIMEMGGDFYIYYVGTTQLDKKKDVKEKGVQGVRIVRTREEYDLPPSLTSSMTYLTTILARNGFVYHWYIELDAPTRLIKEEVKDENSNNK